jgi:beta-glucosidase
MSGPDTPPYEDPSRPIERRVDDLLDRMTLEEVVAQLTAVPAARVVGGADPDEDRPDGLLTEDGEFDTAAARQLLADGVGHVTRIGGGGGLDPETAATVTDEIQQFLEEHTRLGIPAIPHEECLSGYMGPGGTTFPQAIGLANTWSPRLVEGMTERIRTQLRAIGCAHALSPVLDVARDPRWGRTEETFGEDPLLIGELAGAYVRGLQGVDPAAGVSATLKHFAGHGVGEGGKNRSSVQIGERELREVHLRPFEMAVREAGADVVMNAYHDIDGVPCVADEFLLSDVLRGEWGFDGTVVSDYFSVRYLADEHGVARTRREAAVRAVEAGLDVELPTRECYDSLAAAVTDGDVARDTVETAARRVLRQKFEAGLFERDTPDAADVDAAFGPDAHRAYARRVARASVTMLSNDGVLPLAASDTVAVVGPKADAPAGQLGDYAYAAHFPDDDATRPVVTPRDALTARLGDDVTYAEGCSTTGTDTDGIDEAAAAAADSDVAVAFVGARSAVALSDDDDPRRDRPDVPTSGESVDVTDLGLPGVQRSLLEALSATGTPLVVVQVSGKPHSVTWADDHADAVVHAWLPGEEGGRAIADVLLGDHNPSGHLPLSVPKDVGQLPVHYSRKPNSRDERHVYVDSDPLYPFGHGLSYTDFAYGDLSVTDEAVRTAGTVTASVTVENAGERAGHDVVQCYAHQRWPSQVRPVQELVGFERIFLDPGESATVRFEIPCSVFAFHDTDMNLVVEPGERELRIGRSAAEIVSRATVELVGEGRTVPRGGRAYSASTTVER